MALGSETDVALQEAKGAILEALPVSEDEALTETELIDTLPKGVSRSSIRRGLDGLREGSDILRSGKGRRGDPYRYSRAVNVCDQTPTIDGQKENEASRWPLN